MDWGAGAGVDGWSLLVTHTKNTSWGLQKGGHGSAVVAAAAAAVLAEIHLLQEVVNRGLTTLFSVFASLVSKMKEREQKSSTTNRFVV